MTEKGEIYNRNTPKSSNQKKLAKVAWSFEINDFLKDTVYLFAFIHSTGASVILQISIILPFVISHTRLRKIGYSNSMVHTILLSLGFTDNRKDEDARKTVLPTIATYENLP